MRARRGSMSTGLGTCCRKLDRVLDIQSRPGVQCRNMFGGGEFGLQRPAGVLGHKVCRLHHEGASPPVYYFSFGGGGVRLNALRSPCSASLRRPCLRLLQPCCLSRLSRLFKPQPFFTCLTFCVKIALLPSPLPLPAFLCDPPQPDSPLLPLSFCSPATSLATFTLSLLLPGKVPSQPCRAIS